MSFIIPDTILDRLTCHVCKKYLSVKPVKVYRDGKIKCGRCSLNNDEGVLSTYGAVAENWLFRCVNRYEGCDKLLTYHSAKFHEEHCWNRNYDCPICPHTLQFSSFMLLNHFKTEHIQSVLETPEFVIHFYSSFDIEKWYLYKQNDNIFIIHVRYNTSYELLHLNCFSVGDEQKLRHISHNFFIYADDKEASVSTVYKPCSPLGSNDLSGITIEATALNSTLVTIKFNVDLSDIGRFIELPVTLTNSVNMSTQTETGESFWDTLIEMVNTLDRFNTQLYKLLGFLTVVILILGLCLGLIWSLIYFKKVFFELEPEPEPKGIEIFLRWYSELLTRHNKNRSTKFAPDDSITLIMFIKLIFGGCLYVVHQLLKYFLDYIDNIIESVYSNKHQ